MDSIFHCLRRTTIGPAFTVGSRLARSDFTLAKPGSPQAEADQRALGLLRGIRFEPVKETKLQRTGDAGLGGVTDSIGTGGDITHAGNLKDYP